MNEVTGKAELVESVEEVEGETMTATIPRAEAEEALRAEDGSIELFLDVARPADGDAPSEVRRVTFAWEHASIERLLSTTSGDTITLAFGRRELETAFEEADVEAHGLRERALVLSVAVATAAAGAAGASAGTSPASAGYQRAMPGDYAAAAAASESEGYQRTMPSDYARSGQPASAHETSSAKLTEDAGQRQPAFVAGVTDFPSTGVAQEPEFVAGVTDFPSTGVQPQQQPSGEGTGVSIPEPARDAAIAAGAALLITAAGFAARSRRTARPT